MSGWTVVLQSDGSLPKNCQRYQLQGVAHPARVQVEACDHAAVPNARKAHAEIERYLKQFSANSMACGGPAGLGCFTWSEPSCSQILVLVVGSVPLDPAYEDLAKDWLRQSGGNARIIVAPVGPLTHSQVYPSNKFPTLRRCTTSNWGNAPTRLAESVLSTALLDERPGVFISYLRKEASEAGDQIHDRLSRAGYRVFLDRFQGTPGRTFSQELAEEMSSMGVVLLLETSNLRKSRWTRWEAGFARRYLLGPLAVNFDPAARFSRAFQRLSMTGVNPAATLSDAQLDSIESFVRKNYLRVATQRAAYYEMLIRRAAQKKSATVNEPAPGLFELVTSAGILAGSVLPCGTPGRLRHASRLANSGSGPERLLAGEHQNLAPMEREAFRWMAATANITLVGANSMVREIRAIL